MAALFLLLSADLWLVSFFVFFPWFSWFLFSFELLLFLLSLSVSLIPVLSCFRLPEISPPRWRMESPEALVRRCREAVSFVRWLCRLFCISDKAGSPVWQSGDKCHSGPYFSSVFHVSAFLSVSDFLTVSDPAYVFLPMRSCFRNPRYFFFS